MKALVGDRPAGSTPESASIVKIALGGAAVLGLSAGLGEGSTDANIPMSLNVPAITIGGGGSGANAHALTESFDITNAWMGRSRAALHRHFDPVTARMLDALIEGLTLHRALDTESQDDALVRTAIARIVTTTAGETS